MPETPAITYHHDTIPHDPEAQAWIREMAEVVGKIMSGEYLILRADLVRTPAEPTVINGERVDGWFVMETNDV